MIKPRDHGREYFAYTIRFFALISKLA